MPPPENQTHDILLWHTILLNTILLIFYYIYSTIDFAKMTFYNCYRKIYDVCKRYVTWSEYHSHRFYNFLSTISIVEIQLYLNRYDTIYQQSRLKLVRNSERYVNRCDINRPYELCRCRHYESPALIDGCNSQLYCNVLARILDGPCNKWNSFILHSVKGYSAVSYWLWKKPAHILFIYLLAAC